MANDTESVDSNGNSSDLRPRRSNRAKGKQISHQVEETDDNIVVNNVAYKVGDFIYYIDKKQDILRIGLIEELKFQKRDKLSNKKAEVTIKQFYRLDEIPQSVLSNQGEYDTHIMPQNFPDWLRLREIFISDNNLSISATSLHGLCTVRHFPDLNHAMVLFSSSQSSNSGQSPRLDPHPILIDKDPNSLLPVPKHRDDNTFFYVFSYNPRGRKLAVTYLEIRVGCAYQAELPELKTSSDRVIELNSNNQRNWEQLMWKPNQIPEEVFDVYNMATISISCFSGFGGGVDDSASIENGRKIASHMLTRQKALDCLHKSQYNMEKAVEIFAENSLPETNKMPFLWTDEDHTLFDESVKIHGKNFLRIKQDKRNKKCRLVGDYVTFYYFWKKNRPKNRKYIAKKMLRSRIPNSNNDHSIDNTSHNNATASAEATNGNSEDKINDNTSNNDNTSPTTTGGNLNDCDNATNKSLFDNGNSATNNSVSPNPTDVPIEQCFNCKQCLPKQEKEVDEKLISERLRILCDKCQSYFRRYGYQRPLDLFEANKRKSNHHNDDDDDDDKDETMNAFDEEDEDDDGDAEDEEDDDMFTSSSIVLNINNSHATNTNTSPTNNKDNVEDFKSINATSNHNMKISSVNTALSIDNISNSSSNNNKNTLAINKYDFDQEDENVEEVSSLLKRSHAKQSLMRDPESKNFTKTSIFNNNTNTNSLSKSQKSNPVGSSTNSYTSVSKSSSVNKTLLSTDSPSKSSKRPSLSKRPSTELPSKRRKVTNDQLEDNASSRSTNSNKSGFVPSKQSVQTTGYPDSIKSTSSTNNNTSANLVHNHHHRHSHSGKKYNDSNNKKSHLPNSDSQRPFDSTTSSSSTTSSNDSSSSSSSDEAENLPLSKRTHKFPIIPKPDLSKDSKHDMPIKDNLEPSYNQMITQIPNIPGVCAVTEPLSHSFDNTANSQNRRTPAPISNNSIVSTINGSNFSTSITLSSDIAKSTIVDNTSSNIICAPSVSLSLLSSSNDLTINNPTSISTPNMTNSAICQLSLPQATTTNITSIPVTTSASLMHIPEDTVLNLVKKRPPIPPLPPPVQNLTGEVCAPTDHYWSNRHESPSKLMHYRSDYPGPIDGLTNSELMMPKQMLNGYEVVRSSIFGHLVKTVKQNDGNTCSRTDLQHWVHELKSADIEKRSAYHVDEKRKDANNNNGNTSNNQNIMSEHHHHSQSTPTSRSMPPPPDKPHKQHMPLSGLPIPPQHHGPQFPHHNHPAASLQPNHHHQNNRNKIHQSPTAQSVLSNVSSSPLSSSSVNNNMHHPSAASSPSRSNLHGQQHHSLFQPSASPGPLLRPPMHSSHPQSNRPGPSLQQPIQSTPLLMDYVNANKMAHDLLILQTFQHEDYQKILLMNHQQQQQQQQQQQAAAALAAMLRPTMIWGNNGGVDQSRGTTNPQVQPASSDTWNRQETNDQQMVNFIRLLSSIGGSGITPDPVIAAGAGANGVANNQEDIMQLVRILMEQQQFASYLAAGQAGNPSVSSTGQGGPPSGNTPSPQGSQVSSSATKMMTQHHAPQPQHHSQHHPHNATTFPYPPHPPPHPSNLHNFPALLNKPPSASTTPLQNNRFSDYFPMLAHNFNLMPNQQQPSQSSSNPPNPRPNQQR